MNNRLIDLDSLTRAWSRIKTYLANHFYNKSEIDNKFDGIIDESKTYTDESLRSAKEYADGIVNSAREAGKADLEAAKARINELLEELRNSLAAVEEHFVVEIDDIKQKIEISAGHIDELTGKVSSMKVILDNIHQTVALELASILSDPEGEAVKAIKLIIDNETSQITSTVYEHVMQQIDGRYVTTDRLSEVIQDLEGVHISVSKIVEDVDGISEKVGTLEITSEQFSTRITELNNSVSEIKQTSDEISLTVGELEQGNNYAAIIAKLNADKSSEVIIKADKIELNGETIAEIIRSHEIHAENLYVKAANIEGDLTVNSANVIGKLTADQIDSDYLHVKAANIDGTLIASQIDLTSIRIDYDQIDNPPSIPTKSNIDAFIAEYLQEHPITAGDTITIEDYTNNGRQYAGKTTKLDVLLPDGIVKRLIYVKHNGTTTTYTEYMADNDEGYLLTNVGLGNDADGSQGFFKVETGGLLKARNAIIYGSVYANTGYFGNLYVSGQEVIAGNQGSIDDPNSYFDEYGILHCKGIEIEGGHITWDSIDNASENVTLITDSYIRTRKIQANEINTEGLRISNINTSGSNGSISMTNGALSMLDSDDNIRLSISGEELSESQEETISGNIALYGSEDLSFRESKYKQVHLESNKVSFNLSKKGVIMIETPTIDISSGIDPSSGSAAGSVDLYIKIYKDGDAQGTILGFIGDTQDLEIKGGQAGGHNYFEPEKIIDTLDSGSYQLAFCSDITIEVSQIVENGYVGWNTPSYQPCTYNIVFGSQLTEIGRNGFRMISSSSDKIEFITSNGNGNYSIRTGTGSSARGIKINNGDIKLLIGTTTYKLSVNGSNYIVATPTTW